MSDRLKLSDPNGDAELEKIAIAREAADADRRIKELERNVRDLEQLIAEKERLAWPGKRPAKRNNKIGARKISSFKAVSTAPSINRTPAGAAMVPVAYPTIADLSNSVDVATTVRFNGKASYTLCSTQPNCRGDDSGTGGGVRSGTVNGRVAAVSASATVRAEGRSVVRAGDTNTMNSGNNPGTYIVAPMQSKILSNSALANTNPLVTLDSAAEQTAFLDWIERTTKDVDAALKQPVEGLKGALKGLANTPSQLVEMLTKAAIDGRGEELKQSAILQEVFGHPNRAESFSGVSKEVIRQGENVDIPKFEMKNRAQEGGEVISALLQTFAAGFGVIRTGMKQISKTSIARTSKDSAAARGTQGSTKVEATAALDDGAKFSQERAAKQQNDGVRVQLYASLPDGIEVNSKGIHGYLPAPNSRYSKFDFTNADEVARNRAIRKIYLDESKELEEIIDTMRKAGIDSERIARRVVMQRNSQKMSARSLMSKQEVDELEAGNIALYADPVGPTADQLYKKTKDWDAIIEKSMKKDPALNILLGLPPNGH